MLFRIKQFNTHFNFQQKLKTKLATKVLINVCATAGDSALLPRYSVRTCLANIKIKCAFTFSFISVILEKQRNSHVMNAILFVNLYNTADRNCIILFSKLKLNYCSILIKICCHFLLRIFAYHLFADYIVELHFFLPSVYLPPNV